MTDDMSSCSGVVPGRDDEYPDTPVVRIARRARVASRALAATDAEQRIAALHAMAQALRDHAPAILSANDEDMSAAIERGMDEPLQDRLKLDSARLSAIADALDAVADLPEVIGEVIEERTLYNRIELKRIRVPLGVVAMIYEARPNVTADAAGLVLKTANACILRGGSAAARTNEVMTGVLSEAAEASGMPKNCIQSVAGGHEATEELMELRGLVDVLIPRGGAGLIRNVVANAKVPVIETGVGNCHVYVNESGALAQAVSIIMNAKTQRPGVCNAIESLLVDRSIAKGALPPILYSLTGAGVRVHLDPALYEDGVLDPDLAESIPDDRRALIVPATEDDWGREYLDLEISCKLVEDVQEAIDHINTYGTGHSECIIAEDPEVCALFQQRVDAAVVYANASTRFTDGGEFGLGAEIGISTQKLHARGPMGLEALTSSKYVLTGEGQIRG